MLEFLRSIWMSILPPAAAFACFFSAYYIIRHARLVGYWPVIHCYLLLPMLWIGFGYLLYMIVPLTLERLSWIIRGPLVGVLLSPAIDAIIREREAKRIFREAQKLR